MSEQRVTTIRMLMVFDFKSGYGFWLPLPAPPKGSERMTKRLDPEIKALRAIERALEPLDDKEVKRDLEWVLARRLGLPWINLPRFPPRAPRKEVSP